MKRAGCRCFVVIPIESKISRGTEDSESEVRPNLFCFTGNERLLKISSKGARN